MFTDLLKARAFLSVLILLLLVGAAGIAQQAAGEADAAEEQAAADGEGGYTGTWSLVIGPSRLVWQLQAESYEFYAYQSGTVRIGSRGDLVAEDGRLRFIAREVTSDGASWSEVELPEEQATTTFAYEVTEVTVRTGGDGGEAEAAAGGTAAAGPGDGAGAGDAPGAAAGEAAGNQAADQNGGQPAEVEERQVLRLALPGRPQFYNDYQAGSGEPVDTADGQADDGQADNGPGAEG